MAYCQEAYSGYNKPQNAKPINMEKRKWLEEFAKILHVFCTYVQVQANKPLGLLLIEAVFIVFAIFFLHEIAEWINRF